MPRIENLGLAGLDPESLAGLLSQYETVEAFLLRKSSSREASSQAIEQLIAYIAMNLAPKPKDGMVLHQELQDHARLLPTGCSSLDSLLHGGYREGHVTELWGPPASGKSQLCMLAAAVTATRGEGVVYMDTTASCSAVRMTALCQSIEGYDAMTRTEALAALDRVQVVRHHDIHNTLQALDSLSVSLKAQQGQQHRTRLLILDSASALVAPILGGEGPMNQGHALMCILGQHLRALAQAYTLAVLLTNHQAGGAQEPRPALGESWRVQPHLRLQLGLSSSDQHAAANAGPAPDSHVPGPSDAGSADHEPAVRSASLHACSFAACGETVCFEMSAQGIRGQ